ncbi:hypothetical protein [Spirosoma foliorum]|uniref:Lipocalin-like domain-containing protein n=1 Tax=Spirosoma foliorum TaxID=2710596 RepID=A0A7G5GU64_9BACT|nr:hypothetical protein [Spirosoma foliorum]QMW02406.1 hypothetical protein H3H32_31575 [Spirosoma foliorum]
MRLTLNPLSSWLLIFTISLLSLTGCKKTESIPAPDPNLASAISGRYIVTTITASGSTQPISIVNGLVVIVPTGTALDVVNVTLSYMTASASGSTAFSELKTLSLQRSGNAIDLYSGTTKVGSWTSTSLTFTNYPFNNSTVSFTATKE